MTRTNESLPDGLDGNSFEMERRPSSISEAYDIIGEALKKTHHLDEDEKREMFYILSRGARLGEKNFIKKDWTQPLAS